MDEVQRCTSFQWNDIKEHLHISYLLGHSTPIGGDNFTNGNIAGVETHGPRVGVIPLARAAEKE